MIILFTDTETTGLYPWKHGVIQWYGCIDTYENLKLETLEEFEFKIKPFKDDWIDPRALTANGISREDFVNFREPMEVYVEVQKIFAKYCDKFNPKDKMVFAGYNAQFDYNFMRKWYEKLDDRFFGSWFFNPPLDIMNLAFDYLMTKRVDLPNFKCGTVGNHFGIVPPGNLHDAQVDTYITREIFRIIKTERKELFVELQSDNEHDEFEEEYGESKEEKSDISSVQEVQKPEVEDDSQK